MAAIASLFLTVLRAGDHVVLSDVVYGGTLRLFREVLDNFGVASSFVDSSDTRNIEAAITPSTRLIFIETPGNPTLKLTDLEAVGTIARRHKLLLVVDNTFLTPLLQRPLDLAWMSKCYRRPNTSMDTMQRSVARWPRTMKNCLNDYG